MVFLDTQQIVAFFGNNDFCGLSLAVQTIHHNRAFRNIQLLQQFPSRLDFNAFPICAFAGKDRLRIGLLYTDDMRRLLVSFLFDRGTHGFPSTAKVGSSRSFGSICLTYRLRHWFRDSGLTMFSSQ